ncbi:SUZ RNA-binding domain-containing isoform X3 [Paramormyrops kingsleyae]|uniref:SUZ RNA-binding domain-containing isoform X3 n=1 Tax=Paramormyrops kingsleyae TaxID=1676925 RepID=UPI000CD5FC56|nr:SUZ domain-containing protein 1-like isoform X3 [Paramormyrops kingsleyae]
MDDEISDSWEDPAEGGEMQRRGEKLRINQKHSRILDSGSGHCPLKTTAIVIQDGALPAAPQPQIRILKRPSSNGSLHPSAGPPRPLPQVKSLAQREAEYAEARRRILGSASPDESPQDSPNAVRPVRMNTPQFPEDSRPNNLAVRQAVSPAGTQGLRQRR